MKLPVIPERVIGFAGCGIALLILTLGAPGTLHAQARGQQAGPQTGRTPGGTPAGVPPVYVPYAVRPEGPLDSSSGTYKVDAIDFTLFPGDSVEYKYRLAKDATMIFFWKSDAPLRFDFHTVPDGRPASASERFHASESMEQSGVYKAPYAGLHGWWWTNTGTKEVNFRVQAAGFFSQARMFAGTPDGEPFEVQDPPIPPQ